MSKYGLLSTYSSVLCNGRGEKFACANFGDANRLRLSVNADCEAYEARIAELEAERDALQQKLDAVVHELSLFGKPSHERIHAAIAIVEGRDNG